jgi:hypothetical protein
MSECYHLMLLCCTIHFHPEIFLLPHHIPWKKKKNALHVNYKHSFCANGKNTQHGCHDNHTPKLYHSPTPRMLGKADNCSFLYSIWNGSKYCFCKAEVNKFSKIQPSPQCFRHQKGDMRQVSYWGPKQNLVAMET